MSTFKIVGHVSKQHVLSAQVPDTVPPGPVTVLIDALMPPDETDDGWMVGVAHEWADELSDERQDIYTLDDGEPLDSA